MIRYNSQKSVTKSWRFLLTLKVMLFLLFTVPALAQLDPANPPTDDLEFSEVQRKIAAMLPEQPDLLKFVPLCTFKFAAWPNGLGNAAANFDEAFKGYSLKTESEAIFLLDKSARSVFTYNASRNRKWLTGAGLASQDP